MSYIVKSRDFPKNCNECDEPHLCCDFYYCGVGYQKDGRNLDVDEHYLNKTKHPDCPLLELPKKHGKLIDADTLIADLQGLRELFPSNYFGGVISLVRNSPAIIEAEVNK